MLRIIALALTAILLGAVFYRHDLSGVLSSAASLHWTAFVTLSAFLCTNLFFACVRFHVLLRRFGVRISFWPVFRGNTLAQVAASFLLPIFGHIVGRAAFLKRHNIPAGILSSVTVYERLVTLASSSLLCLAGLAYLFGHEATEEIQAQVGDIHLFLIAIIAIVALSASYRMGALRVERLVWKKIISWHAVITTIEAGALTFLAHACMVAAYAVIATHLFTNVSVVDVLAASAVIMFLAGLPISVNGWGIREISSIYLFGRLGVASDRALAASVLLGLTALFCLLTIAAIVSLLPEKKSRASKALMFSPTNRIDHERAVAVLLSTLAGVTIFFQLHVPVQGTLIAVNAADPLVLAGAGFFLIHWVGRREIPRWKVPRFNLALALMTALISGSFLVGYASFGATAWALNNRLIGWLVILAYFFTGANASSLLGNNGLKRVLQTLTATGCIVALYLLARAYLDYFGIDTANTYLPNFREISPNRNAVAFQLLLVLACALVLSKEAAKKNLVLMRLTRGLLVAGIVSTGSRAGMGTVLILIAASVCFRLVSMRGALLICAMALALLFTPVVFNLMHAAVSYLLAIVHGDASSQLNAHSLLRQSDYLVGRAHQSQEVSNRERWHSLVGGLAMWREHLAIGGGLGAYLHQESLATSKPVLIHSTPIWLLAELGVVGFAIFSSVFVGLFKWGLRHRDAAASNIAARTILLTLIVFAVFSTVHEILYQRITWLILGACIALRGRVSTAQSESATEAEIDSTVYSEKLVV